MFRKGSRPQRHTERRNADISALYIQRWFHFGSPVLSCVLSCESLFFCWDFFLGPTMFWTNLLRVLAFAPEQVESSLTQFTHSESRGTSLTLDFFSEWWFSRGALGDANEPHRLHTRRWHTEHTRPIPSANFVLKHNRHNRRSTWWEKQVHLSQANNTFKRHVICINWMQPLCHSICGLAILSCCVRANALIQNIGNKSGYPPPKSPSPVSPTLSIKQIASKVSSVWKHCPTDSRHNRNVLNVERYHFVCQNSTLNEVLLNFNPRKQIFAVQIAATLLPFAFFPKTTQNSKQEQNFTRCFHLHLLSFCSWIDCAPWRAAPVSWALLLVSCRNETRKVQR